MKRFRAWLHRHQGMCAVKTDLQDTVYLHAGDYLEIMPQHYGYSLSANVMRRGKLEIWPIAHATNLREIWDLREALQTALDSNARRFNATTRPKVVAKTPLETSEVAF